MAKHRIFIAVPVPADVQRRLLTACTEWRDLPIRWTKEENIHITVLFIGSVNDEELSRIASSLAPAMEGVAPFSITFDRIGIGPDAKHPRVVWAEGQSSAALHELKKRVEDAAYEDDRRFAREDDEGFADGASVSAEDRKPFRLHVTLGRMILFKWAALPQKPEIEKRISETFTVDSVVLMESELTPQGPNYTVLATAELG